MDTYCDLRQLVGNFVYLLRDPDRGAESGADQDACDKDPDQEQDQREEAGT